MRILLLGARGRLARGPDMDHGQDSGGPSVSVEMTDATDGSAGERDA